MSIKSNNFTIYESSENVIKQKRQQLYHNQCKTPPESL